MTITQIEENLNNLVSNFEKENFIFDLLLAFGEPQATMTRLQKGELNQLDSKGEVHHRKKVFFKVVSDDLHLIIDKLRKDAEKDKQKPRFIIVTDYETLLAYDTKTTDTLDINIQDIAKHYDFFLPFANKEKAIFADENPANVRASLKMAKLYDELKKNNEFKTTQDIHALNVFLTRLLFCYFAEDTNIFPDNAVTSSISSYTQLDGSDVNSYLARLFKIFNIPEDKRDANTPIYLNVFPYVNGGLFRGEFIIPKFTTRSRQLLLEVGQLQWSQINPDIFGSMIQAVVRDDLEDDNTKHYTSEPNILKILNPLFLDELYQEFEKSYDSKIKLQNLLNRLTKIKIFDPACGSGNFLIIAYKKLRELEMNILQRIDKLNKERSFQFSNIKLTQFYGIEYNDFAHEVAMLSLWLVEHQMNLEFYKAFGRTIPSLPLHDGGNIFCENATQVKWEDICPKNNGDEIYILGNPPFEGARKQKPFQKEDMKFVFNDIKGYNNLDYVTCWFYKAAKYIQNTNFKSALVSTNSICQGEQVGILWPHIFNKNLEIDFAYHSFKWKNNAKDNAAVTVIIIGLRNISTKPKYLFTDNIKHEVKNINAYLLNSDNIFIDKRTKPLSKIPEMNFGSMPNDGGHLLLSSEEKNKLLSRYPNAQTLIRQFMGSQEFIRGEEKYCLWIDDNTKDLAYSIPEVNNRIEECRIQRENSSREATNKLAGIPYKFAEIRHKDADSIIVPSVSSDNRKYVPTGFLDNKTIISNLGLAIYNAKIWMLGIVTSYMHMCWVRTVSGRLGNGIRYSVSMSYNTFPFPNISEKQKEEISELVFNILDEREQHSEKTLAQMYDPDKMPKGLKEAHHQLDLAIEKCYRAKLFENDEERLEYLFKLYEEMIKAEGK